MKLNFIAAWQVTCGMVIKADAITKRLLIKQTKLQLTYLCISVLTLNKFEPGIQVHISLQEWQTTVTRGVYINSLRDSLHGQIRQKKKNNAETFRWNYITCTFIACVASVSNRVIARKLERKQKKGWRGRGRGRGEEETLARKPQDSGKRPLIFHGSVDL